MRFGSAKNFCPPTQEGISFEFEDEEGQRVNLEFLGLIIDEATEHRWAFFFPLMDGARSGDSGEIVVLEVTELDEEGQPVAFEMLADEQTASVAFEAFKSATAQIYDFE